MINFRDKDTMDMGSFGYNIDRRLMERGNQFNQFENYKEELSEIDNNQIMSFNNTNDTLTHSHNIFTFYFLEKFIENLKSRKSIILSPYSIISCFSLLYIGSKNQTEYNLSNYFNFLSKQDTYTNMCKITQELAKSKVFSSLNLVLHSNDLIINEAYRSDISKIGYFIPYNKSSPTKDTEKINRIISQSTGNMINNFIHPDILKQNIMVLINTIYFHSKWQNPFNVSDTRLEQFGKSKTTVQMMSQKDKNHRYYEDTQNQVLEMDYNDGLFCMGFVLPKNENQDPQCTDNQFNYYMTNLKSKKINLVKIPRFKTDSRYSISNLFKKYGLREIFETLDLSMVQANNNLYISDVIHAAIIEVDESGTKAAAATGIFIQDNCMLKTEYISFVANHPFLYYIKYKPYNLVLFVGVYY